MAARLTWQTVRARPAVVSFAVLSVAYFGTRSFLRTAHAESNEPPKVFGGFGFTTLRLRSSELVNHNTKRLVFEYPDENAQSGLSLTCKPPFQHEVYTILTNNSCPSHYFSASRTVVACSSTVHSN